MKEAEMKELKRYPIWSNCLYTFRALRREEGTRAFAVCVGDTLCSVLLPFLEAAMAGAAAACLVSGKAPWVRLLMVAGYILLLQGVRFLQGNLKELRNKLFFLFRIDITREFERKTLEMDIQSLESAGGRKKWEAAQRNLYMGNGAGIEAYAKSYWDMLANLGGLAVYGVSVGRESGFLLAFLVLQTFIVTGFHLLAARRTYGMEEEIEDIWKEFRYLRRESILPGNGKDIRLYRMDRWFPEAMRESIRKICALLLCGLYRPSSGKIYLDGQDMQTLSQREIFREFAVVFQEVFAFSFPLSENVSCAQAGTEDGERLRRCLEKAGLWERVQALPKKAGTSMNQGMDKEGVTLSGGELQKMMLARALYKDAPVVILDEPTAALDPIAESEMYEKYDGMIRGKTAVFISHKLSSTRFCDRILFMEQGRILQEGSHESLMKQGGAYAELFALQARYYQKAKK